MLLRYASFQAHCIKARLTNLARRPSAAGLVNKHGVGERHVLDRALRQMVERRPGHELHLVAHNARRTLAGWRAHRVQRERMRALAPRLNAVPSMKEMPSAESLPD